MDCPRCVPDSDQYAVEPCPHCDGSGKIKEGDVWRCLVKCLDTNAAIDDYHAYVIRCEDGWKDDEEALFNYHDDSEEWIVTPVHRMKPVKETGCFA